MPLYVVVGSSYDATHFTYIARVYTVSMRRTPCAYEIYENIFEGGGRWL